MEFDARTALGFYIRKGKLNKQFFNFDKRKIALLPYNTDQSDEIDPLLREDFSSFDGYLGDCLRAVNNKANKIVNEDVDKEFEIDEEEVQSEKIDKEKSLVKNKRALKATIISRALKLTDCKDDSRNKLHSVLDSVFFSRDNLLKYGNMAQMYMFRNSEDANEEISNFIQSIFLDEESSALLRASSDNKKHLLHVLMDKSLPPLVELKGPKKKREYHKLDEKVIELFKKDFSFLSKDKDAFLNESSLLFKFYYFFYVYRATLILANMFSDKEFQLYFTLETESVSESRRTYDVGWKTLESRLSNLFSHTVCLDLLNHIPLIEVKGPLDYIGIRKLYLSLDQSGKDMFLADVKSIYDLYYSLPASDMNWDKLEDYLQHIKFGFQIENELEQQIFRLFGAIDFQFEKFQRKGKRDGYGKWFSNFCKVNILKSRGKYGYTLSLSSEMLLFLTKLCTGDQPRIKLKDLWAAFKERGIYFDDYSQQAIMVIYDKINLIEKKSDSGDAQYIRRIL